MKYTTITEVYKRSWKHWNYNWHVNLSLIHLLHPIHTPSSSFLPSPRTNSPSSRNIENIIIVSGILTYIWFPEIFSAHSEQSYLSFFSSGRTHVKLTDSFPNSAHVPNFTDGSVNPITKVWLSPCVRNNNNWYANDSHIFVILYMHSIGLLLMNRLRS